MKIRIVCCGHDIHIHNSSVRRMGCLDPGLNTDTDNCIRAQKELVLDGR